MRVLLINYEYPPVGGGASNATWEIARAMVQLGHQPVVLTAKYRGRTPDTANPGIKVIEVPAIRRRKDRCSIFEMTTFVLSATWCIRKILKAEKIEGMIAFFSIPCGPIAWWGWRKTKIPYIVSLRGGDVPGTEPSLHSVHVLLRQFRRRIFRDALLVVANSTSLKVLSEREDPISVSVIPNGVDSAFWHPRFHEKRHPLLKLIFVGRFRSQKNLLWLMEQLAEISGRGSLGDWEMELVGNGPQKDELLEKAKALKLDSRLRWHGWQPRERVRELYQEADVLIDPAAYEGMPNVVLEALACGLKVVVSRQAEGGDGLFEGRGAHVYEPAVPGSFFTALSHAAYTARLRDRTAAIAVYSWQSTAAEILRRFEP